ncbi:hypothetical protein [Pseudonocardia spinosispora]|uniref:hypothetical protein n=1 Tax=Pseudonocardia spinosispora TaxID=103441 RepID=UPI0003F74EDC|nr:hypothetical protein [Pseudonocardia spinosispora]
MTSPRILLATPVLLFGYGVVRLLDPSHSPGVVWTVSHLFYLAGFLAQAAGAVVVFRLLRDQGSLVRRTGGTLVFVGWFGALCGIGQATIDLLAGAGAADKAQRAAEATRLREVIPGAEQLFYGLGPSLAALALIALLAIAAARTPRYVPWWSPPLALAAAQLPSLTLDLIPVAALLIGAAIWPVHRRLRTPSRPVAHVRTSAT